MNFELAVGANVNCLTVNLSIVTPIKTYIQGNNIPGSETTTAFGGNSNTCHCTAYTHTIIELDSNNTVTMRKLLLVTLFKQPTVIH